MTNDTRKPREFKFTVYEEPNGVSIVWDTLAMPTETGDYCVVEKNKFSKKATSYVIKLKKQKDALEKEIEALKVRIKELENEKTKT